MDDNIIKAYEDLFNSYKQVNNDEYVAKESLQDTMMILMMNKSLVSEIKSPKPFIRAIARTASRNIIRGKRHGQKVFYSSETTEVINEDGDSLSVYEIMIEDNDNGQIASIEDRMLLSDIYKFLGEDLSFFIENIEFPSRGRLRGVTGVSNRPKIFENESERKKHHYIRKKIKKRYGELQ